MKKRILVTGGTGFIGSALVHRLVKNGEKVRVLDNQSRGDIRRLKDIEGEFEFIKGDIRDPKIVEKACSKVECVIHLAYINGTQFFYEKPELVLEVGVKGIINILDGCVKNKVREFFLASSSEVYQTPPVIPTPENVPLVISDPLNPRYSYGGGKIISELLTINYGRKFFKRSIIFRPHNVYGPDMGWEHVIPQLTLRLKGSNTGRLPIQGSGNESRAFIYIDDFIEGLNLVINRGKHLNIYHIGTNEEITIEQLAKEIGNCLQKEIMVVPGKLTSGSPKRRCPDISKLKKLGFRPKVPFKKGLQSTVKWYNTFAYLQPKVENTS